MKKLFLFMISLFISNSYAIRGGLLEQSLIPKDLKSSVVAIEKRRDGDLFSHSCTGTILDRKTVLTAAHCFDDKNVDIQIIYNGRKLVPREIKISSNYLKRDLIDPYWQYVYDIEIQNDFAVIVVDSEFAAKDIVSFYEGELSEIENKDLLVSGYGQTANIFGMGEGEGVYRVSDFSQVSSYTSDRIRINDGSTGSCLGDSGGPLWITTNKGWRQLAITSQGDCSTFGLYEIVSKSKILNASYYILN